MMDETMRVAGRGGHRKKTPLRIPSKEDRIRLVGFHGEQCAYPACESPWVYLAEYYYWGKSTGHLMHYVCCIEHAQETAKQLGIKIPSLKVE